MESLLKSLSCFEGSQARAAAAAATAAANAAVANGAAVVGAMFRGLFSAKAWADLEALDVFEEGTAASKWWAQAEARKG